MGTKLLEELLLQELPEEKLRADLLKYLVENKVGQEVATKIKSRSGYLTVITRAFYADNHFLRLCSYRVQLALGEVRDVEMLEAEDGFVLIDYSRSKEILEVEFSELAK